MFICLKERTSSSQLGGRDSTLRNSPTCRLLQGRNGVPRLGSFRESASSIWWRETIISSTSPKRVAPVGMACCCRFAKGLLLSPFFLSDFPRPPSFASVPRSRRFSHALPRCHRGSSLRRPTFSTSSGKFPIPEDGEVGPYIYISRSCFQDELNSLRG